jgi:hypothetical protein
MMSNQISLNPSKIVCVSGAVAFFLVLVSIGGQVLFYTTGNKLYGLVLLFDIDAEYNIPTFYSMLLLLFTALLLLVIAILEKKRKASHSLHWAILSFGFFLMAIDEIVCLHERLVSPIRRLLGAGSRGIFNFAWVIPGIALVLILVPLFLKFWLRLPSKTRFTFLMASSIYIGGSIGFELIGGYYAELHGLKNLAYNMLTSTEESLEMAGIILFIWGLLTYIADSYKEVQFCFDECHEEVMLDGPHEAQQSIEAERK